MVAALDRIQLNSSQRPFQAFGAAEQMLYCREQEVLLCGVADSGKSRACLEKLHIIAQKYASVRILILRKSRESINESAKVTYEEKVLPEGWRSDPRMPRWEATNNRYVYPNGSVIVLGGFTQAGRDTAGKIMSAEYDVIYVQEATDLREDEWEKAVSRLRNGAMPYQQLIADANPSYPTHWLKRRCDRGQVRYLIAKHTDNPSFTPARQAILDSLTGVRRKRLRDGIWAAAEGQIYEEWDDAVHVIDAFDIPADWPRYWAIDFGFTHPFVLLCAARDPDGVLYVYRQIYHTQRLVEDHAAQIKALSANEPKPVSIFSDHDAQGRATFEKHSGLKTTAAEKAVLEGIQAVQSRLRARPDGRRGLYVLRDCLVERDNNRADVNKLPASLTEEMPSYIWADTKAKEAPVKDNDDGVDTLRYLVMGVDTSQGLNDWTAAMRKRLQKQQDAA